MNKPKTCHNIKLLGVIISVIVHMFRTFRFSGQITMYSIATNFPMHFIPSIIIHFISNNDRRNRTINIVGNTLLSFASLYEFAIRFDNHIEFIAQNSHSLCIRHCEIIQFPAIIEFRRKKIFLIYRFILKFGIFGSSVSIWKKSTFEKKTWLEYLLFVSCFYWFWFSCPSIHQTILIFEFYKSSEIFWIHLHIFGCQINHNTFLKSIFTDWCLLFGYNDVKARGWANCAAAAKPKWQSTKQTAQITITKWAS